LHKDPKQRPSIKQVQNSPFFWTNKQRLDHVKFVLRGPKEQAVNKKHIRQLIPSAGHFGEMPEILSMIRDSNSGIEAIESLATEFCSNPFGKDDFIQGNP
jgi:hypothetical protein